MTTPLTPEDLAQAGKHHRHALNSAHSETRRLQWALQALEVYWAQIRALEAAAQAKEGAGNGPDSAAEPRSRPAGTSVVGQTTNAAWRHCAACDWADDLRMRPPADEADRRCPVCDRDTVETFQAPDHLRWCGLCPEPYEDVERCPRHGAVFVNPHTREHFAWLKERQEFETVLPQRAWRDHNGIIWVEEGIAGRRKLHMAGSGFHGLNVFDEAGKDRREGMTELLESRPWDLSDGCPVCGGPGEKPVNKNADPDMDRCPSCEHQMQFHQPDGCRYNVIVGRQHKPMGCPCGVGAGSKPIGCICGRREDEPNYGLLCPVHGDSIDRKNIAKAFDGARAARIQEQREKLHEHAATAPRDAEGRFTSLIDLSAEMERLKREIYEKVWEEIGNISISRGGIQYTVPGDAKAAEQREEGLTADYPICGFFNPEENGVMHACSRPAGHENSGEPDAWNHYSAAMPNYFWRGRKAATE